MRWRTTVLIVCFVIALSASVLLRVIRPSRSVEAAQNPPYTYDQDGNFISPQNYREWMYVTSGVDMSYTDSAPASQSRFDNVFVDPASYQAFLRTGTWPDKTAFILEIRKASDRGSINLRGHYQDTQVVGIEAHVKDASRFPGKWAFFSVDPATGKGKLFPQTADCYSCHASHGAVDTTFIQFYPTLLPIARDKGTLSAAFLKESTSDSTGAAGH